MSEPQEPSISSVQSSVLDLPPCCIEFSPLHPRHFVVGTYFLDKKNETGEQTPEKVGDELKSESETALSDNNKSSQHRTGSIEVYHMIPEKEEAVLIQTTLQQSAILDLHFHQSADATGAATLVAVTSTGTVTFHQLDPISRPLEPLVNLATQRFDSISEEDGILLLHCSWHPTEQDLLAVTTSDGRVLLARVDLKNCKIKAYREIPIENQLENWFVALTPTEKTAEDDSAFTIFSGGDDSVMRWVSCVIKANDTGEADDEEDLGLQLPYPPASLKNQHMAGVTSILPLSTKLHDGSTLLVSGSYDDMIRVFAFKPQHETYGLRSCRLLSEATLGGGVWRIKVMHADSGAITLLVSCMYAGTRIVRLLLGDGSGDGMEFEILARFEEHKSMNYGSEFVPGFSRAGDNGGAQERLIVSTSFYDRLMCVWRSPV
ncbi:hypothetical protein BROUX41_006303 [Berkeleyomyces rouxiae]|uniref:uncharacterized protein n=1 Tax=Berkeleyomyces rouxiae TaxID=2035830 RepID=UPI003B7CD7D9